MKIIIKSTVGLHTPTDMEVDPKEKIGTVKERAATTQAIDPESVQLMHNGEPLDDDKRIKDYGIREGDTLELVPKHRIGAIATLPPFSFDIIFNNTFAKRISEEARRIKAQNLPIKPLNPKHWIMYVKAERGKWKGKTYTVHVELSDFYPYVPPKVIWKTPLDPPHPNIFPRTGWVCLNILEPHGWKPVYSLITVYDSLKWLLENPNYEDREDGLLERLLRRRIP